MITFWVKFTNKIARTFVAAIGKKITFSISSRSKTTNGLIKTKWELQSSCRQKPTLATEVSRRDRNETTAPIFLSLISRFIIIFMFHFRWICEMCVAFRAKDLIFLLYLFAFKFVSLYSLIQETGFLGWGSKLKLYDNQLDLMTYV